MSCRVAVHAGKLDQAQELAGHLAAAYPGNPSVNMLQAVLLAKSGKVCMGYVVETLEALL